MKDITQEDFAQLNTDQIQLLDVRTPNEVKKGVIEGAKMINFYDKDFKSKVVAQFNKNNPLYIYCAAGGRSNKASSLLVMAGFKDVYNLEGGYRKWNKKQKNDNNSNRKPQMPWLCGNHQKGNIRDSFRRAG